MADKKRIKYIDAVAGVMIGWMILGHCLFFSHYSLSFYKYLGFFMPWFFYKSGLFFSLKKRGDLLRKDIFKFIRYYVVYSFFGWSIWVICRLIYGFSIVSCLLFSVRNFISHNSVIGNSALWFLFSLFVVRQASNVALRKMSPPTIGDYLFFHCIHFE